MIINEFNIQLGVRQCFKGTAAGACSWHSAIAWPPHSHPSPFTFRCMRLLLYPAQVSMEWPVTCPNPCLAAMASGTGTQPLELLPAQDWLQTLATRLGMSPGMRAWCRLQAAGHGTVFPPSEILACMAEPRAPTCDFVHERAPGRQRLHVRPAGSREPVVVGPLLVAQLVRVPATCMRISVRPNKAHTYSPDDFFSASKHVCMGKGARVTAVRTAAARRRP